MAGKLFGDYPLLGRTPDAGDHLLISDGGNGNAIKRVPGDALGGFGASTAYAAGRTNEQSRTLVQRLGDTVNAKDFGAIGDDTSHPVSELIPGTFANIAAARTAYGIADLQTTDTIDFAVLQYLVNLGRHIYLPAGSYIINRPIRYDNYLYITGAGNHWYDDTWQSRIAGSFAKPLFQRKGIRLSHDNDYYDDDDVEITTNFSVGTACRVQLHAVHLENAHLQGDLLQIFNIEGPSSITNCRLSGRFRGVTQLSGFGPLLVSGNAFTGYRYSADGTYDPATEAESTAYHAWGLYAVSHATVINNDFTGWGCGTCVVGGQINVISNRYETNNFGLRLGGPTYDPNSYADKGANRALQGSVVMGQAFEANVRTLDLHYVINCTVQRMSGSVTVGCPGGDYTNPSDGVPLWLVRISSVENSRIDVPVLGGPAKQGLIVNNAGASFENMLLALGGQTDSTRAAACGLNSWASLLPGRARNYHVVNATNLTGATPDANAHENQSITAYSDLQLRGLKGLSVWRDNIQPNNFAKIETVANGTTSLAITFPGAVGMAQFAQCTAGGTGHTLPAGDYYYGVTYIADRGETGLDGLGGVNYKLVTVTSGQRVALQAYGGVAADKCRFYRGRLAQGVVQWEGCIEANPGDVVYDDGTQNWAARRIGPTAVQTTIPSAAEPDADYGVSVTPYFDAGGVWVTSRSTSGFTINWKTAASGTQALSWLLYRP